jgi:hypothetical protein
MVPTFVDQKLHLDLRMSGKPEEPQDNRSAPVKGRPAPPAEDPARREAEPSEPVRTPTAEELHGPAADHD